MAPIILSALLGLRVSGRVRGTLGNNHPGERVLYLRPRLENPNPGRQTDTENGSGHLWFLKSNVRSSAHHPLKRPFLKLVYYPCK